MASGKEDFKKDSYWTKAYLATARQLDNFPSTPQQNSLTASWQIHFGLRNWRKSSTQKLAAKVVKPELD